MNPPVCINKGDCPDPDAEPSLGLTELHKVHEDIKTENATRVIYHISEFQAGSLRESYAHREEGNFSCLS